MFWNYDSTEKLPKSGSLTIFFPDPETSHRSRADVAKRTSVFCVVGNLQMTYHGERATGIIERSLLHGVGAFNQPLSLRDWRELSDLGTDAQK